MYGLLHFYSECCEHGTKKSTFNLFSQSQGAKYCGKPLQTHSCSVVPELVGGLIWKLTTVRLGCGAPSNICRKLPTTYDGERMQVGLSQGHLWRLPHPMHHEDVKSQRRSQGYFLSISFLFSVRIKEVSFTCTWKSNISPFLFREMDFLPFVDECLSVKSESRFEQYSFLPEDSFCNL